MRQHWNFKFLALGLAVSLATCGAFITTNVFADEEADVQLIVVNDPAEVAASGPSQGVLISAGNELPDTTIEYKNAKVVKIQLLDPNGNVIAEKSFNVSFSPDAQTLTMDWDDGLLTTFGKYTIKTTATGTDGETVSATNITFYYGARPSTTVITTTEETTTEETVTDSETETTTEENFTVPDTGRLKIFGQDIAKRDFISGLLAMVGISGVGLAVILKKGAKNEK